MNTQITIGFLFEVFSDSSSLFIREHAYLDPGSGSFILQLIIATLLGGLFVIRGYWSKILSFFRRLLNKEQENDEE